MLFCFLHPLNTKAGLQTFAVVYVLFPFKLLPRMSGKPLVIELKVLLLLGGGICFPLPGMTEMQPALACGQKD